MNEYFIILNYIFDIRTTMKIFNYPLFISASLLVIVYHKFWIGVFFMVLFFIPINAENLSPDMARIYAQRKIIIAMHYAEAPPFYMLDKKGRLYGFEVELGLQIGRSLGVDVEFKREAKTLDEVVTMVSERRADIALSSISRTQKRGVRVNFTNPHIRLHHAILINRLKTARTSANKELYEWINTTNISLGTVEGTPYVEFAQRDYPNMQLIQYSSWNKAAADVLAGKIHAALFDDTRVLTWINENPQKAFNVQTIVMRDREDPIAIAVHWQDGHLLSWLNLLIDTLSRDGTLEKLTKIYLRGESWKDYRPIQK